MIEVSGDVRRLPSTAVADLAARVRGPVLTPAAAGYEQAVDLYNAAVRRRPDLVVRATGTEDVVTAVRFARTHGLDLSVKGGGHGVAGLCTAGQLVVDCSLMRRVVVEAGERRASAQAGCRWGDLDAATQLHGLATPGGRVTHTGIAGLTLGGGQGWLSPRHGLACDNLVSAEVVTADGRVLTAGPGADEELLWALRGGGGNFGVVTRFDYRLHEVGSHVLAGVVIHPLEVVEELVARYVELVDAAGPDLGGAVVLASAPEAPFVPPAAVRAPVVATTLAWFGTIDVGERVLRPVRELGTPLLDTVAPVPYTVLQAMTDAPNPWGLRNYWSPGYSTAMSSDVVRAAAAASEEKTSPLSSIVITQMGEAVNAVPEDATAFAHRDAAWQVLVLGMWADAGHDAAEVEWVRATRARLTPFASAGAYLNDDSRQGEPGRVREVFGADKYRRLASIKAAHDPDNVFRHAPNVLPVGRAVRG